AKQAADICMPDMVGSIDRHAIGTGIGTGEAEDLHHAMSQAAKAMRTQHAKPDRAVRGNRKASEPGLLVAGNRELGELAMRIAPDLIGAELEEPDRARRSNGNIGRGTGMGRPVELGHGATGRYPYQRVGTLQGGPPRPARRHCHAVGTAAYRLDGVTGKDTVFKPRDAIGSGLGEPHSAIRSNSEPAQLRYRGRQGE